MPLATLALLAPLAATCFVGCTYCAFWDTEDNRPVPKEEAYKLFGRAPQPIPPDLKQDAEKMMAQVKWDDVPHEFLDYAHKDIRYKREHKENRWRVLLVGYVPRQTAAIVKKRDVTERVYGKFQGHAPGYPIPIFWWSGTETWYSLDTGEEVSYRSFWGAGPAGVFGGATQSVRPDGVPAFVAVRGSQLPYNAKRGWHILGGLIAGGSINGQSYFQIAWIPIATGKAPAPPPK
jgi:hypothetical protein